VISGVVPMIHAANLMKVGFFDSSLPRLIRSV
jgi:hypothetical protein